MGFKVNTNNKPWHMHARGVQYSCFVCHSECSLLCYLLYTMYLVYVSKANKDINMHACIVWTFLKMYCSGDIASFACHDNR